jgi:hypothetical protein
LRSGDPLSLGEGEIGRRYMHIDASQSAVPRRSVAPEPGTQMPQAYAHDLMRQRMTVL